MSASEYLPHSAESHNGNGSGKIFTLQKTSDPEMIAVIQQRDLALEDSRLSAGAKVFIQKIFAMALNPRFYDCKGVVATSDSWLAENLGRSRRIITQWKKAGVAGGYFWVTKKMRGNMWPQTVYHLSVLHKPQPSGRTDRDGTFFEGAGRMPLAEDFISPKTGRAPGFKKGQASLRLPGSRKAPPEQVTIIALPDLERWLRRNQPAPQPEETVDLLDNSLEASKSLRLPSERPFAGQANAASLEKRTPVRRTSERSFAGEANARSPVKRTDVRPSREQECEQGKTQDGESRVIMEGEAPRPDLAEFRKSLEGMFPSRLDARRNELQAKLSASESPDERKWYRERIGVIDECRFAGKPPRQGTSEKARVPKASGAKLAKEPTPEELLDGAKWAAEHAPGMLTAAQKAALAKEAR